MSGDLIELDEFETRQTGELLIKLISRVVVVLQMEMNERGKDVDELVNADIVDVAELLLQAAVLVVRERRTVEVEAREVLEAVALLILEFVERALARVRLEERLDYELRTRV